MPFLAAATAVAAVAAGCAITPQKVTDLGEPWEFNGNSITITDATMQAALTDKAGAVHNAPTDRLFVMLTLDVTLKEGNWADLGPAITLHAGGSEQPTYTVDRELTAALNGRDIFASAATGPMTVAIVFVVIANGNIPNDLKYFLVEVSLLEKGGLTDFNQFAPWRIGPR